MKTIVHCIWLSASFNHSLSHQLQIAQLWNNVTRDRCCRIVSGEHFNLQCHTFSRKNWTGHTKIFCPYFQTCQAHDECVFLIKCGIKWHSSLHLYKISQVFNHFSGDNGNGSGYCVNQLSTYTNRTSLFHLRMLT